MPKRILSKNLHIIALIGMSCLSVIGSCSSTPEIQQDTDSVEGKLDNENNFEMKI